MSRRNIEPEILGKGNYDEWTSKDEPIKNSFYDRYGFDERDGPSEEEEEECGYQDDPDEPLDELNYRRRH